MQSGASVIQFDTSLASGPAAVLKIRDLTHTYRNGVNALGGITWMCKGECTGCWARTAPENRP